MKNSLTLIIGAFVFVVLTAAGASRYVNGTEIPNAVTLLYSSGGQNASLGNVGVSGTLSVTGSTSIIGAMTMASDVSISDISASVTASVGSAQGSGPITNTVVRVSTSASAGDAQTLPSAVAGLVHVVCNHAAANAIDVFPASGDQINIVTADAAVSLAAGECMICFSANTTNWGCVIGSAS